MIEPRRKLQIVRPTIRSDAITYWFDGRPLPAGTYRVRYGGGALAWGGNLSEWGVGDAFDPSGGFYVTDGTNETYAPQLNDTYYPSPGAAQQANAAAEPVEIQHGGGPLGVYLRDSNYADNLSSPWGNPAFILEFIGPATAWSPAQLAGLIAWYRSDSGLFTTAAGSTPAVNEGDPIGRWEDRSGNGNHLTQTTLSRRPSLTLLDDYARTRYALP